MGSGKAPEILTEIFDKDFYNSYYGCTSNAETYWIDSRYEGRYINSCTINDNFDYGLFISKLNWLNINIITEFEAIKYFLDNKAKYQHWFQDIRYKQPNLESNDNNKRICCLYTAYLNDGQDLEIALNSIPKLLKFSNKLYIVALGKEDLCKNLSDQYSDYILDFTNLYILKEVKKYDLLINTNNNIYIHDNLNYIIKQSILSNSQVFSINDKYNITNNDEKYYYGINSDFIIFDKSVGLKILKCLYRNFNNFEYNLNKLLIDNNIKYDCLIRNIWEKEVFWNNLFNFDVLDYRYIVKKYHSPIISKHQYRIDMNNMHGCVLSKRFLDLQGDTILDKSYHYSNKINPNKWCCHLHIGTYCENIIQNIVSYIDKIKSLGIDIYITSLEPIENIESYVLPNIGADIGAFLYILDKYIFQQNYKYVLKIHSKTHHGFRNMCFNSLINNLGYIEYLLENKQGADMCGLSEYNYPLDHINQTIINKFCNKYNISDIENVYFFAGTMFACNINMLKNFIKKYNISIPEEYFNMEYGYQKNHNATVTHSWERILSGIIPAHMRSKKIYI